MLPRNVLLIKPIKWSSDKTLLWIICCIHRILFLKSILRLSSSFFCHCNNCIPLIGISTHTFSKCCSTTSSVLAWIKLRQRIQNNLQKRGWGVGIYIIGGKLFVSRMRKTLIKCALDLTMLRLCTLSEILGFFYGKGLTILIWLSSRWGWLASFLYLTTAT